MRPPRAHAHHLLLRLGQGGTAQVFLAVQSGAHGVDKLVVLKSLQPGLADHADMQQMLLEEARFSARLNHANIVQTTGIVQAARGPAIVMEYLEGQSLAVLLSRTRATIPLGVHLRIIVEALRGLHHAHELTDLDGESLNVVHRDVTPQNVFVTYDGQVKLIDFGIAKFAGAGAKTDIGVIKGKIRYMPPEQIQGRDLDRRVDVFAVGVMLWEAATRTKMWDGREDVTVMHFVLSGEIPRPRSVTPEVDEELERIITKALSFDRADRYATAAELEADLEAFLAASAQVTNRDISRFISREFADVRAETKRLIDQRLRLRAASGAEPLEQAAPGEEPPLLHTITSSDAQMSAANGEISSPVRSPSARRSSVLIAAFLALAVGAVASQTGAFRRLFPQPQAASSASAPVVSLSSAQVPSAQVPSAPALSASAPADAPADAPTGAPALSASAVPAPRARHVPRPVAPPARPKISRPGCEPPFTVDANGTKRFKAECL